MDTFLRTYRAFGLLLSSDIALPELQPSPESRVDCRFRMHVAAADRSDAAPTTWFHESRRSDGRVWIAIGRRGTARVIRFPGVAEFTISADGHEITGRRARGVPLDTARHLLLDHVLPRVLDLRGALVLHAGAAATEAGAVLLLGRSGKGKSTLSASLARAGFRLLGDDVIVLRETAGSWLAVPSYPGLRLWPDSALTLLEQRARSGRVAHYTNKTRGDARRMGAKIADAPVPVVRAYVLEPAPPAEAPSVTPLSMREAFGEIVAHTFRFDPGEREALRDELRTLARIAGAGWFRRLVVPRSYDALEAVLVAIRLDLARGAAA